MFLIMFVVTVHPGRISMLFEGRDYFVPGAGVLLILLFFVASRDALRKYYARTGDLLGFSFKKGPNNDERLASEKGTYEVQGCRKTESKEG